jgi:L-fucose isomerase-like protein
VGSTRIAVFTVASPLSDIQRRFAEETYEEVKKLFSPLGDILEFAPLITSADQAEQMASRYRDWVDGGIVVVWSGGTDRMIYRIGLELRKPLLVYAHPAHNSLASVREAIAALRNSGVEISVGYGEVGEIYEKISPFLSALRASVMLTRSRFAQIGEQEPWILIRRSPEQLRSRFGLDMVKIRWEEMFSIAINADRKAVADKVAELKTMFGKIERSDEDLEKAVRIYMGIKEVVKKYSASSAAVEARDMLDPSLRDWGPYLGVAMLSDEGIPSDYEGEHDAIITKLVIYHMIGKASFMTNLTRIDNAKNTAVFSHCTVPISMIDPKRSVLLSYYETDRTVAIRGRLREGEKVTFARLGGKDLDKIFFGTGVIVNGDLGRNDLCRTQIEVRIEGSVRDLIDKTLGNHIVVVYGDLREHIRYFAKIKSLEAIEI